jgi:hypothetical protein
LVLAVLLHVCHVRLCNDHVLIGTSSTTTCLSCEALQRPRESPITIDPLHRAGRSLKACSIDGIRQLLISADNKRLSDPHYESLNAAVFTLAWFLSQRQQCPSTHTKNAPHNPDPLAGISFFLYIYSNILFHFHRSRPGPWHSEGPPQDLGNATSSRASLPPRGGANHPIPLTQPPYSFGLLPILKAYKFDLLFLI